jgi:hypothetical protein
MTPFERVLLCHTGPLVLFSPHFNRSVLFLQHNRLEDSTPRVAFCVLSSDGYNQTSLFGAVVVIRTGQHLGGMITVAAKRAIPTRSSSHAFKDAFMDLVL